MSYAHLTVRISLPAVILLLGAGLATAATESVCTNCGTISAIEKKAEEGKGTGVGIATGAVLGAVAGREIIGGKRSHRNAAAVVGAVAGGYAGNEVEKNVRSNDYYVVSVRMDSDQHTESVRLESAEAWAVGDRVRLENGSLVRRR